MEYVFANVLYMTLLLFGCDVLIVLLDKVIFVCATAFNHVDTTALNQEIKM